MARAEAIHSTSFCFPDTGKADVFSPNRIDPSATVSDLWAMRPAVESAWRQALVREYAARHHPLVIVRQLEAITSHALDDLWNLDWNIIRTPPRSLAEIIIRTQVLEQRICPDDGTVPEQFLRDYCAAARRLALS